MTRAVPPAALFFKNSRRSSVPAGDMEASVWNQLMPARAKNKTTDLSGQVFAVNRQAAQALAGRGKDGVADRGSNDRYSGLTDAGWGLSAGHEVNFDRRSFVHANHFIVVEIGLHDAPALDGDGVLERGSQSIDGGALHLGANAIGIDGAAAIHGTNQTIDLERSARGGNIRDRRYISLKRVEAGNAPALPLRKRLAPACFFRSELQYAFQPGSLEREVIRCFTKPRNFPVAADEFQPKGKRILASGSREFIDEALHDEAAAGVFDGAPPGARHAGLRQRVFDADVRRCIRNGCAGSELCLLRFFHAILAPLDGDGGRGLEMFPGCEISLGVQSTLQFVIGGGAIKVVLHVIFSRPQNHHRLASGFRNLRRLHHKIRLIAPAEATAH